MTLKPGPATNEVVIAASVARRGSHLLIVSTAGIKRRASLQLKSDVFGCNVFAESPITRGESSFRKLSSAVYGLNDAPSRVCQTLRNLFIDRNVWLTHGKVFCASSDFDANIFSPYREFRPGFVGPHSTLVDDFPVCGNPSTSPEGIRVLTLRSDVLKAEVLRTEDTNTELVHCGLEIARTSKGFLGVSQCSYFGRPSQLVAPRSLWTQRGKPMEPSFLEGFRLVWGRLS